MPPLTGPKSGDALFASVDRVNAELFTLTYGAMVRQLLTDLEEVEEVNKQLDQMYCFATIPPPTVDTLKYHRISVLVCGGRRGRLRVEGGNGEGVVLSGRGGCCQVEGDRGHGGGGSVLAGSEGCGVEAGDGVKAGGGVEAGERKVGYNIGTRLVDEFLAKSNVSRCVDFKETADVIAKLGFKMFLGVTATVTNWDAEGTSCSFVLEDNPLVDFVELPDICQGLQYCNVLSGVIRGALEMVSMKTEVTWVRDMLRGDDAYEMRVKLTKQVPEEYPYKDDD
uniref:Trafficking protein particle complex subunit n=2 Tax=BOP clade TaxID=359160 RepID=A0A0D9WY87_9ORYZ